MAPWLASQRKRPAPPGEAALQAAWKELASDDAKAAFPAIRVLVEAGAAGLPLMREGLRPAKATDPKHLERLLAALGSDRFADRERATRELQRLDDLVERALQRFLMKDLSLETRRRAEAILARVQGPIIDPHRLQQLRAVEALEYIALPGARQILEALSKGAPEARLTREARESLQRLRKRDEKSP